MLIVVGQLPDVVRTNGVVTKCRDSPLMNFHGSMWQNVAAHGNMCQLYVAKYGEMWQHVLT